jgi:hypothetical protein
LGGLTGLELGLRRSKGFLQVLKFSVEFGVFLAGSSFVFGDEV